jgi:hypothetical protein
VSFASGFNEFAYTASVNVLQKTNKGIQSNRYKDSDLIPINRCQAMCFRVSKILSRFENRITIEVPFLDRIRIPLRGMRISDLINKADGLKEDAYNNRAQNYSVCNPILPLKSSP